MLRADSAFDIADSIAALSEPLRTALSDSTDSSNDFTVSADVEATLAAAFEEVAGATGFRAEHHRLDLVGRCRDCA